MTTSPNNKHRGTRKMNGIVFADLIFCCFQIIFSYSGEMILFHEPSYCAIDEYFNVNQLKCITCDSEKNLVPSEDAENPYASGGRDGNVGFYRIARALGSQEGFRLGFTLSAGFLTRYLHFGLTCVCNEKSKIISAYKEAFPTCEQCQTGLSIPTKDKRDCISCPIEYSSGKENETVCDKFDCPPNHAHIERYPNGTLRRNILCVECKNGTKVSPAGIDCIPCDDGLASSERKECSCSQNERLVDDLCVDSSILKDWPDERSSFTVTFENGRKVHSQFFQDNLLRAVALCKMNNHVSCQLAANMCVMKLYADEEKSSPCSIFKEYKRIPVSNTDPLPWLYYGEGEASTVLQRRRISAQYNLDMRSEMSYLNLTGVFHNLDGSLGGVKKISGSMMQLCPGIWKSLDSSLRFASKYSHSCDVTAHELLENKKLEFIDLFLHYKDAEGDCLYAIPVLIKNLKGFGTNGNEGNDKTQWQFVRRFFFVDKVSGIRYDEDNKWPVEASSEVVRYLKSAVLNVRLQGTEEEGKIFVPYLILEYGELTGEEIEDNVMVSFKFQVNYEMENSLSHALEVSMGVFSALAVVWSIIRTWSHSRRSGRVTIDMITLAHLLLFTCGNLANVFFLIVFCASLDIFVFFKGQSAIHVLLPEEAQEEAIKIYIIVAFLLKIVEVCHLIYCQITIDIFFIDWERPRARNLVSRTLLNGTPNSELDEQQPVSIWRTYFVANEWNEIQTKRKLNTNIHLLTTVLILKCFGIEQWTTTDPELFEIVPNPVGKSSCFICHFAVGGLIFLITYTLQRLFMTLIYERYIKNGIQEFVDVCSMANISVFILALENYGFYIHGRSAHGFADTDMQNIINQLQREEEDLVGHRGLLPGTDQQTFEMTVPAQLRLYYRKVMAPLKSIGQSVKRLPTNQGTGLRTSSGMDNMDKSIQAYHNMNRFLAAFLEHALKDLDYEVREKMFTESLLGIEFIESPDKGVLYSDNGHSFDNVLFYGNEFCLLTFDIMLFSFVEVVSQDYLVAGILTAAVNHVMAMIRDLGGRKNLAKKTLIDERFLI